jgi:hypothetical protein
MSKIAYICRLMSHKVGVELSQSILPLARLIVSVKITQLLLA